MDLTKDDAAPPMQQTNPIHDRSETPVTGTMRRRFFFLAGAMATLILLGVLPPLVSVNRYQRRIAASISASLGRPVHLDKVTLNLLPLPGFTLDNFVVDEDPAFGAEPVIRANSVRATLRISSLWSRRVEFSTISFTEPSVNLVHTSTGKWNLDSILLHASQIAAAPTDQRGSGPAPRFPYIEATGARLNLKLDNVKTPISLTDADFALWLPEPQQWHLRLSAHPARTDANVSNTGSLTVEGTLGRASSLAEVPVNLRGEWSDAPLGAASLMVLGRDAGLRGNLTLSANLQGTVGHSGIQATLHLSDARRADFVPEQTLNVDMQCVGVATSAFYSFQDIRCSWPPAGSSDAPMLDVSGTLPDIRRPAAVSVTAGTPGLPAATLLEWLRVASSRVPADVSAAGTVTGELSYNAAASDAGGAATASLPASRLTSCRAADPACARPERAGQAAHWEGRFLISGSRLINPSAGGSPLVTGDVSLYSVSQSSGVPARSSRNVLASASQPRWNGFVLAPMQLALGGKDPAMLEGRFDGNGYTLHLTGMASISRIKAFAAAIPPLSDGLAEALPSNRASGPFRVDLTATRVWGSPQVWAETLPVHPGVTRARHP